MPALPNPRHERFAQAFFKGLGDGITQHEAYRQAGYAGRTANSAKSGASRLMLTIVKRVRELQAEQAKRLEARLDLSKERVGRRLDKASQIAEQQNNASAMATSELGIAKVFGHITDKQEIEHSNKQDYSKANSTADIGRMLLAQVGHAEPSASDIEQALAAQAQLVEQLEAIRDRALGVLSTH